LLVPPLRDRREDIPLLAHTFIEELAVEYGKVPLRLTEGALAAMSAYGWPGNVRELRNIIERLVIMVPRDRIHRADLPPHVGGDGAPRGPSGDVEALLECTASTSLKEGRARFEKIFIARKLADCGYNVSRTAEALGVERSHLHRKLKAYGLTSERGDGS